MKDHFKVIRFLENLDKKDLKKLGGALGLSYPKLRNMHMESLCEDMIAAWLNKEDFVSEKSGDPSWDSLKTALSEIGQAGIANAITEGRATRIIMCTLFMVAKRNSYVLYCD